MSADWAAPVLLRPIGVVRGSRAAATDDDWDRESASIELDPERFDEDALRGLDAFSHVEVLVHLHQAVERDEARQPRGDLSMPRVGIFAQRAKDRPNRIGATVCRVLGISGRTLRVAGLDAIDGTPVLDLKPWMEAFGPRGRVHEPEWAGRLMARYWAGPEGEATGLRLEVGRGGAEVQGALGERLRSFNVRAAGPFGGGSVAVSLRDGEGRIRGGLNGEVYWGWFYVDRLVIDDAVRGQGWGARVLQAGLDEARGLGAHSAMLDTFSFQAPGFYRKQGWTQVAETGPWADGHLRFYFVKRLVDEGSVGGA